MMLRWAFLKDTAMRISPYLIVGLVLVVTGGCAADRCGCFGKRSVRLFSNKKCKTVVQPAANCGCIDLHATPCSQQLTANVVSEGTKVGPLESPPQRLEFEPVQPSSRFADRENPRLKDQASVQANDSPQIAQPYVDVFLTKEASILERPVVKIRDPLATVKERAPKQPEFLAEVAEPVVNNVTEQATPAISTPNVFVATEIVPEKIPAKAPAMLIHKPIPAPRVASKQTPTTARALPPVASKPVSQPVPVVTASPDKPKSEMLVLRVEVNEIPEKLIAPPVEAGLVLKAIQPVKSFRPMVSQISHPVKSGSGNYYGVTSTAPEEFDFESLPPIKSSILGGDIEFQPIRPLPQYSDDDQVLKIKAVPYSLESNQESSKVPFSLDPTKADSSQTQNNETAELPTPPVSAPSAPPIPVLPTTEIAPDVQLKSDDAPRRRRKNGLKRNGNLQTNNSTMPEDEWDKPKLKAHLISSPKIISEPAKAPAAKWAKPSPILRLQATQVQQGDQPSVAKFNWSEPLVIRGQHNVPSMADQSPEHSGVDTGMKTIER
jgi:hypothetical protein